MSLDALLGRFNYMCSAWQAFRPQLIADASGDFVEMCDALETAKVDKDTALAIGRTCAELAKRIHAIDPESSWVYELCNLACYLMFMIGHTNPDDIGWSIEHASRSAVDIPSLYFAVTTWTSDEHKQLRAAVFNRSVYTLSNCNQYNWCKEVQNKLSHFSKLWCLLCPARRQSNGIDFTSSGIFYAMFRAVLDAAVVRAEETQGPERQAAFNRAARVARFAPLDECPSNFGRDMLAYVGRIRAGASHGEIMHMLHNLKSANGNMITRTSVAIHTANAHAIAGNNAAASAVYAEHELDSDNTAMMYVFAQHRLRFLEARGDADTAAAAKRVRTLGAALGDVPADTANAAAAEPSVLVVPE